MTSMLSPRNVRIENGAKFAVRNWSPTERAWLRALTDTSPAEALFLTELVGTFDAIPVALPTPIGRSAS